MKKDIKNNYELGERMAKKIEAVDKEEYEILINRLACYDDAIRFILSKPFLPKKKIEKHISNLFLGRHWDLAKRSNSDIITHYNHWVYRVLTVCYDKEIVFEDKPKELTKMYTNIVAPHYKGLILDLCSGAIMDVQKALETINTNYLNKQNDKKTVD